MESIHNKGSGSTKSSLECSESLVSISTGIINQVAGFFHLRNLLDVKKVEICKELSEEKVLLFIGPFFITGGGGLVGGCPSRIRSFRG